MTGEAPINRCGAVWRAVFVTWVLLSQACSGVQTVPGHVHRTSASSPADTQLRYRQAHLAFNFGD